VQTRVSIPFNLARMVHRTPYVSRVAHVARALHVTLTPVWSEAAPPAPLRGHFFGFGAEGGRSKAGDPNDSARIPDHDVVPLDASYERSLVVAETERLDQSARPEVEHVAVHRTGHAIAMAFAFAQACSSVVARVVDRVRYAVD
jgi:hypothetical protein